MEVLAMKRDLPAIEDGRWVDKAELPALQDLRVKVRGYSSKYIQDRDQARKRALTPEGLDGKLSNEQIEVLGIAMLQDVFVDVEGLTSGDKVLGASDVIPLLADPAYEPLASLILRAAHLVNQSRVARAEALTKN